MKVTFKQNGRTRTFEPSIYNEYHHMRIGGGFFEWQNALAVVGQCRGVYLIVQSYKEVFYQLQTKIFELDDEFDLMQALSDDLEYLASLQIDSAQKPSLFK